jgi:hypothetical protein
MVVVAHSGIAAEESLKIVRIDSQSVVVVDLKTSADCRSDIPES